MIGQYYPFQLVIRSIQRMAVGLAGDKHDQNQSPTGFHRSPGLHLLRSCARGGATARSTSAQTVICTAIYIASTFLTPVLPTAHRSSKPVALLQYKGLGQLVERMGVMIAGKTAADPGMTEDTPQRPKCRTQIRVNRRRAVSISTSALPSRPPARPARTLVVDAAPAISIRLDLRGRHGFDRI